MGDGQRVGLMGGTFDPLTHAHLFSAEWARDALALHEVVFLPTAANPLKTGREAAPEALRLEMLHSSLAPYPEFVVNPIEIERGGKSYTIETVEELKRARPEDQFFFLHGSDALATLPQWKEVDALLDMVQFVVLSRPGHSPVKVLDASFLTRLMLLPMPELAISSTLVRERRREGRSIRFLVPPEVEATILRENLYCE